MPVNWRGDEIKNRMTAAQVRAVNETMAASVVHAKSNHGWQNQTGTLEGSIDIQDYAEPKMTGGVSGVWGTRDVRYALIHELGGIVRPVKAKALKFEIGGRFVQVQQVEIPARPYLRPAADTEYPKLAARIRRAFERGASGGGPAGAPA